MVQCPHASAVHVVVKQRRVELVAGAWGRGSAEIARVSPSSRARLQEVVVAPAGTAIIWARAPRRCASPSASPIAPSAQATACGGAVPLRARVRNGALELTPGAFLRSDGGHGGDVVSAVVRKGDVCLGERNQRRRARGRRRIGGNGGHSGSCEQQEQESRRHACGAGARHLLVGVGVGCRMGRFHLNWCCWGPSLPRGANFVPSTELRELQQGALRR
eukprot:COSAG01_NODE_849_length_13129_cov_15.770146_4_plen_218_part_00